MAAGDCSTFATTSRRGEGLKKDNKAQVVVNRCNNNENQIWTSPFLTKGKWFFLVDVTQLSPAGGIGDVARAMANFAVNWAKSW